MADESLFARTCSIIERFLQGHPDVALDKEKHGWIWVRAKEESGFDVGLSDEGDEVIVHAYLYHEHQDNAEEAAAAFMWLLTPSYRVVGTFRGKLRVKGTLERLEGDRFVEMGTVRTLIPSFGKKRIEVFQNHIIDRKEEQ